MTGEATLQRDAALTPVADKKGKDVLVCMPEWFDEKKKFKIANAPERTAKLEFTGADLNFMARVLYAEASGAQQLPDKAERDKEKAAILNVNHFRLNRKDYPNRHYVALTFEMVCRAPGQFETVDKKKPKWVKSAKATVASFSKAECNDLDEALAAVQTFMTTGPTKGYEFDNFRGYKPGGDGQSIGRSRFWLSLRGAALLKETP